MPATWGRCLHLEMGVFMHSLVGQPAVPFTLSDTEGKIHHLDDYRRSWLLMVFHRHLG